MNISDNGLKFIQSFEGYHTRLPNGDCKAYLDTLVSPSKRSKGYKGLWTIGYGSTGPHVTEGVVWTKAKAEQELRKMVARHEQAVLKLCKQFKFTPNQNQFDALVSHSYNCGPNGTRTVMRNDFDFSTYGRTAGGVVRRGLVRRRKAEQELFNKPSVTEIVSNSRQLKAGKGLERFLEWSGISALLSIATLESVREFLLDPKLTIALGIGFLAWVTIKYINFRTIEAANEGRYTPSGKGKKSNAH